MKLELEQNDIQSIAREVAELLNPLLRGKDKQDEDNIFDVHGLADYLKVTVKWIYDHTYELPHFKLGGLLRFRKKDIDRVIDRLSLKIKLNNPLDSSTKPMVL